MGDQMLRLAWPLRGAIDGDVLVLSGNGQRNLPFKIEVVLPAQIHAVLMLCGAASIAARASPRFSVSGVVTSLSFVPSSASME